jgi:hypothetical protein
MTANDDLTDSSPESPAESLAQQPGGGAQTPGEIGGDDQTVDPTGDPGGDSDLGSRGDDLTGQGPGVDGSDQGRGNLDGSTVSEGAREESLSDASDAVRDPSEASPDNVDGNVEGTDLSSYTDVGDSGQDNGLNE